MKFNDKKLADNTQGVWIVNVDGQDWTKALEKARKQLEKSLEIPGFRKGKAPKSEVAKHLTTDKVYNEAFKELVSPAFTFALEQKSKLEPMTAPTPSLTKVTADEAEITFTFDLRPEVKLGQYKGLGLAADKLEVKNEEIEDILKDYQNRFAMEVPKESGAKIADHDVVTFDFKGFVDEQPFDGGEAADYKLEIGSNQFVPGFEEQMIGLSVGPDQKIKVTFPTNYPGNLSGKDATFVLNIKEIAQKELPEIDDELAKDVNLPNIDSLEKLKSHIEDDIKKQKTNAIKNKHVDEVLTKVIENSEIDIPSSAIKKEAKQLKKELEQQLQQQGGMTLKDYKKARGMSESDIEKELEVDAKARLQSYLVTSEIIAQEPVLGEVNDEEVEAKLQELATQFGIAADQIRGILPTEQLKNEIKNEKLISFLFDNNQK